MSCHTATGSSRLTLQWAPHCGCLTACSCAGEELTLQRLAVLNFSAAAALQPEQVLLHYLVAACDSADAAGARCT